MHSQFTRIPVNELQLGMYVTELDRPWLDTPFLLQGFLLSSKSELSILKDICQSVVIDTGKSPAIKSVNKNITPQRRAIGKTLKQTFPTRTLNPYEKNNSLDDELQSATKIYDDYESAVVKIFGDANTGQTINIKAANEAVGEIVNSLIRNPSACTLLHKMKKKGDYLYDHAIGTSIWAATIGRQIGLPPADLKRLAISGLLCDIGKVSISNRILNKPSKLTNDEFDLIKSHVLIDEEFNKQNPNLAQSIIEIINTHHERHDGSGYPHGFSGDKIPVFSRIVGLADCYDAMTSDQPYSKALSSYESAKELYELRDVHFQAEIVEQFIQAVGLYPVGSLLELNRGDVGVVVDVYASRRLRPKLLMLLDVNKESISEVVYLDLLKDGVDRDGNDIEIKCCLAPGSYDLDADELFL